MPKILETKVTAYGLPEEHKIKAALDTGEIVTYYPKSQAISVHSNSLGGLGRFLLPDYRYPEIIAAMINSYNLETKPS